MANYESKVMGDKLYHAQSEGYGASVELFGAMENGETPMSLLNIALAGCVTMCVQGYFKRQYGILQMPIEVHSTYNQTENCFAVGIDLEEGLSAEEKVAVLDYVNQQCRLKKMLRTDLTYDMTFGTLHSMVNERLKAYQKKWAYEKYLVMAHSQQHYNALRQLFKGNIWIPEKESEFHRLVQKALAISPTTKTIRTAYQHVWGYFKKVATTEELETYKDLEASLEAKGQEMHDFLRDMTAKYQPSYLLGCHLMELKRLL